MLTMLEFAKVLAWPVVALVALVFLAPRLDALLPGARLKLNLFGQEIETTLPELQRVLSGQAGEPLNREQHEYLASLLHADGHAEVRPVAGSEENWKDAVLKPLRDAGLIHTIPRHKRLEKAESVQITPLGRLYLKHVRKP